jgi:hypothetical protein
MNGLHSLPNESWGILGPPFYIDIAFEYDSASSE